MSRLKKDSGVAAACITGACSIIGSLIVALVVSYISKESTIESVKMANEKDKEISALNLALQKEQFSKTLENQYEILKVTAKNNLDLVNETFSKNKEIQDIQLKSIETSNLKKEKRDLKKQSHFAIQYLTSDISTRINILEKTLLIMRNEFENPFYKVNLETDSPWQIISKKLLLMNVAEPIYLSVYPVEYDIVLDNIQKLTGVSPFSTVRFYRQIEYLRNFIDFLKKKIDGEDPYKKLQNILTNQDLPENFKNEAVKVIENSLYSTYHLEMKMIKNIVINGYDAIIDLKESVKANAKGDKDLRDRFIEHYKYLDTEDEKDQLKATFDFIDVLEENLKTGKEMGKKIVDPQEINTQ